MNLQVTTCKLNCLAGVVFCDMCDENSGSVVQSMGFEVVDFGVHEKLVGKRQFCSTMCENLGKFCIIFLWRRRLYWGKLQNFSNSF